MESMIGTVPADLLTGRTVMVVGGAGNVGTYAVSALLAGGARVVVTSRSEEKLERMRSRLGTLAESGRLVPLVGSMSDEAEAPRILESAQERAGPLDAAIASLGDMVFAPMVLEATGADLRRALDGYLIAHFMVARTLVPALAERGGSYTFINGPLAFDPIYPGTGLVSIATAGQAMLARLVMQEWASSPVRVNEVVLYTRFGPGAPEEVPPGHVGREDVGRYLAFLASDRATDVRGRTIHLRREEAVWELAAAG